MKVDIVSGAGGTLGDNMAYSVICDWLNEFGIKDINLNPENIEGDRLIIGGCGIIYDEGVVKDGHQNQERAKDPDRRQYGGEVL